MSTEPTLPAGQDLESLVHLETMFQEYGFEDGFRDGEQSGELEGRIFGCEKAFDLGHEVGFYQGATETWTLLGNTHADFIPAKALRHIEKLKEQLDAFPTDNDPNADLMAMRDKMRNKMRIISSLLGVKQKYQQNQQTQMNY
ncbi:hypothetical protein BDF14DRAFT_1883040 [Spinellus fusiger]|nr:hypothetical protein BDF14DRAFT_1883040 [Spinellus fusiger]